MTPGLSRSRLLASAVLWLIVGIGWVVWKCAGW